MFEYFQKDKSFTLKSIGNMELTLVVDEFHLDINKVELLGGWFMIC